MARINLLPWREARRQERQRNFMMSLVATAAAAAVLVLLANWFMNNQISGQESRNDFLRDEIRKLENEIRRIENLTEVRENLLQRKEVIERLQENRSLTVHLFNQMSETVPEGVRLSTVRQSGQQLTIQGASQSESRVSDYMRRIESADWLHDPQLGIVESTDEVEEAYRFVLRARLSPPQREENEPGGVDEAED